LSEVGSHGTLEVMMRIHYAGGSELTGTDIADALMDLAEVLGRSGTARTIEIPIRNSDGGLGRSRFLVGPASQIVIETEESELEEIIDVELVLSLKQQAEAFRPHSAIHADAVDTLTWDPELDDPLGTH
jgi:hypothetical protein